MSRQNLMAVALILSVSANLLIAGVLIGRASQRPPEPPPAEWMGAGLDPQTRQLVRRRMAGQMEAVRPFREELRGAMVNVRRAVTADPYDPDALARALAQMRDVRGRYEAFIHENLAEVSAELSRPQRAALLRAALQRGIEGNRRLGNREPERKMPPRPGG